MGVITINASIFPLIMSMSIGEAESPEFQSIDLPREANLLYLQSLKDSTEITLLKKFTQKETFSDEDYTNLFNLFLNTTPRLEPQNGKSSNLFEAFGVTIDRESGTFQLIERYIPQIKVDTWDYITIDFLKDSYIEIINCFDFGDIEIYLGSWKSDSNEQKQSLLNAFRNALMFTLIGFLYGDDKILYKHFKDFFENEFYKRVAFIHGIWKHREDNKPIKYIPVFDSFYNLTGNSPTELIQIIHAILSDDNIVQDEKMMIKNRLIEGARTLHSNMDSQSVILERSLIKPVVNYLIEMQSADDNITAAESLHNQKLFEASINRSYYSMMHALKALLENKQQLSDWEPGRLNVNENHKALEQKLRNLSIQGIITNIFVSNFQYVKQKRWAADYNIAAFSEAESYECVSKARGFISEVKKLSL